MCFEYLILKTVGNHEFDHGPEEVALFLDAIESPNVLANVDLSDEPILWDKFLNSTVLVRGGRKIGIIGIIKSDINVSIRQIIQLFFILEFFLKSIKFTKSNISCRLFRKREISSFSMKLKRCAENRKS